MDFTKRSTLGAEFWWAVPRGWDEEELFEYNRQQKLADEEVRKVVEDNLAANPLITIRERKAIRVTVTKKIAILSGTVHKPRTKVLAYAEAYWSCGVEEVINRLQVVIK